MRNKIQQTTFLLSLCLMIPQSSTLMGQFEQNVAGTWIKSSDVYIVFNYPNKTGDLANNTCKNKFSWSATSTTITLKYIGPTICTDPNTGNVYEFPNAGTDSSPYTLSTSSGTRELKINNVVYTSDSNSASSFSLGGDGGNSPANVSSSLSGTAWGYVKGDYLLDYIFDEDGTYFVWLRWINRARGYLYNEMGSFGTWKQDGIIAILESTPWSMDQNEKIRSPDNGNKISYLRGLNRMEITLSDKSFQRRMTHSWDNNIKDFSPDSGDKDWIDGPFNLVRGDFKIADNLDPSSYHGGSGISAVGGGSYRDDDGNTIYAVYVLDRKTVHRDGIPHHIRKYVNPKDNNFSVRLRINNPGQEFTVKYESPNHAPELVNLPKEFTIPEDGYFTLEIWDENYKRKKTHYSPSGWIEYTKKAN